MSLRLRAGLSWCLCDGRSVFLDLARDRYFCLMADWWQADPVFFELLRDREVMLRIVAEVAGERVAEANAKEKGSP